MGRSARLRHCDAAEGVDTPVALDRPILPPISYRIVDYSYLGITSALPVTRADRHALSRARSLAVLNRYFTLSRREGRGRRESGCSCTRKTCRPRKYGVGEGRKCRLGPAERAASKVACGPI